MKSFEELLSFEFNELVYLFKALAVPGALEKFFPDPKDASTIEALRNTFAELWGLENADDQNTRAVIQAIYSIR